MIKAMSATAMPEMREGLFTVLPTLTKKFLDTGIQDVSTRIQAFIASIIRIEINWMKLDELLWSYLKSHEVKCSHMKLQVVTSWNTGFQNISTSITWPQYCMNWGIPWGTIGGIWNLWGPLEGQWGTTEEHLGNHWGTTEEDGEHWGNIRGPLEDQWGTLYEEFD